MGNKIINRGTRYINLTNSNLSSQAQVLFCDP